MPIADNIELIRERIAAAARRVQRDPASIILMGVSKTFYPDSIQEAYAAGIRVFGENKVQEFNGKASALADLAEAEWHLIGHLQTNKASKAAELFSAIDSVDSVKLAEKLNAVGEKSGKSLPVLIEVNVGGEEAKSGITPGSEELDQILLSAPRWKNLSIRGLMTVPPFTDNPEEARPFFRQLRKIFDSIRLRGLPAVSMETLSMGMSHDFEIAIEEGSTCVRIGTALFGERK